MGFKLVIQYIASHYVLISGSTLALFFTASMILLIRSIGEKGERDVGGHGSDLDLKAIEGAMKRVLASQPVSIAAGSILPAPILVDGETSETHGGGGGSDQSEAMRAALREREATIEALRAELQQAKETILGMGEKGGGAFAAAAGGADSGDELAAFKGKIDELQARLAEYEIIEDDIADLSMYKDENARLKLELERLKAQGASVAANAQAAVPAPEVKFEKVDRFELDPNDDVMKEFAAAVEVQRAPPPTSGTEVPAPALSQAEAAKFADATDKQAAIDALLNGDAAPTLAASQTAEQDAIDAFMLGDAAAPELEPAPEREPPPAPAAGDTNETDLLAEAMDTDKMLSEVESIAAATVEGDAQPLEESLDTDKLLAEVDSLSRAPQGADVDDVFAEFSKSAGVDNAENADASHGIDKKASGS